MARHLLRIVMLRAFGVVLFTAFLVAFNQWRPLLGDDGITPVNTFLDRVAKSRGDEGYDVVRFVMQAVSPTSVGSAGTLAWNTFKQVPSYLWFVPRASVDDAAVCGAVVGMALSALVILTGACAAPAMLTMWGLYLSLISVGQDWYSFGWESQLCETAFLMVFVCPLWWERIPHHGVPGITTYLLRWLLFRIMLGAGLIKLRGDECWRDLTCMKYHYHTQPVPNPASPYFHAMPTWFHTMEVVVNHIVECVVPFFLALPQPGAAIGAVIQVGFQLVLISSGNLSFLNWLTIVPALAGLDDRYLRWMFSAATIRKAEDAQRPRRRRLGNWVGLALRWATNVAVLCAVGYLSVPVVENLLSPRQAMNTGFDWLRLVNTYGAFGSITRERNEVIVEGRAVNGTWLAYEFKCKPGDVNRRPCLISPYHYRLDWLMWFAAFGDPQRTGWLLHMAYVMLEARTQRRAAATIESLIAYSPFAVGGSDGKAEGPTAIRMTLYEYEYRTLGRGGRMVKRSPGSEVGEWWHRHKVNRQYLPEVTRDALTQVRNWYKPKR